jgi:hypothetical protein
MTDKNKTKARYFYISAKCIKLIDMEEEIDEGTTPKFESGSPDSDYVGGQYVEKNGKKYKAAKVNVTCIVPSPRGLFFPAMLEHHLKTEMNCEEAFITFVREMSEEEFQADCEYRNRLKEEKENGPKLPENVKDDIEDLITRCEKGDLNVYKTGPKSTDNPDAPYNPLIDNVDDLMED